VAARSKAEVCGHSPVRIAVSTTGRGHGCYSLVSIVFCLVEVL